MKWQVLHLQSITATLVYTYNGDGLLVSKSAGGQTTRYTWDLAAGLPQMLGDGSTLYVPGVGEWSAAQGWVYYLPDGLGSVRQLADSSGYIVQRYSYGPFGEALSAAGTRASAQRYTGERWDGDAGLLYLRARWYDPATGRFLSKDPFPGFAALPQTQHPYVYCQNNPVLFTDPSGEVVPILLVMGLFAVAGSVGSGVGYIAVQTMFSKPIDRTELGVAMLVGFVSGGLSPLVGGVGGAVLLGAGANVAQYGLSHWLTGQRTTPAGWAISAITGGLIGGIMPAGNPAHVQNFLDEVSKGGLRTLLGQSQIHSWAVRRAFWGLMDEGLREWARSALGEAAVELLDRFLIAESQPDLSNPCVQ